MSAKARAVGINHVALEVGDIEAALDFYGRLFHFELRGRGERSAFIDMGDQFLALMEVPDPSGRDAHRHFGLVVDDREKVRQALAEVEDVEVLPGSGLDIIDPWGNWVQVIAYEDIQFTKTPEVLEAMDLARLDKTDDALEQLARKGVRVGKSR